MVRKKITSASNYRKAKRKIVELSSGFTFKIQKMSPTTWGKLIELTGTGENATEEEIIAIVRSKIIDVMFTIIPECVVDPRIIFDSGLSEEELDDQNIIDFNDLSMEDATELMDEIYRFSGIAPADVEEREEFRDE